jgi:hypothetical protein
MGKTRMNLAEEQNAMRSRNKAHITTSLPPKVNPLQEEAPAEPLHKLARATSALLRSAPVDKNGIIIPPAEKLCLDLRVSKAQLQRTISVASVLLYALEKRGFTVTAGDRRSFKSDPHPTSVHILGQDVAFYIEEDLRVKERREREWSTRPELIYEPSGKLILRVSSRVDNRTPCRQRWADGKTQLLEGLFPLCVEGFIENAERMATLAAETQARELRWELERKERAEEQRRIQEEAARVREAERLYTLANPEDLAVLKKEIADLKAQNEALERERENESSLHSYEKERSFWAGRNRR